MFPSLNPLAKLYYLVSNVNMEMKKNEAFHLKKSTLQMV